MAEQNTGPVQVGAEMDYSEHDRTYALFLAGSKYVTIFVVSLLIAMAFGFFTAAGFFSATVIFVLVLALATYLLR